MRRLGITVIIMLHRMIECFINKITGYSKPGAAN